MQSDSTIEKSTKHVSWTFDLLYRYDFYMHVSKVYRKTVYSISVVYIHFQHILSTMHRYSHDTKTRQSYIRRQILSPLRLVKRQRFSFFKRSYGGVSTSEFVRQLPGGLYDFFGNVLCIPFSVNRMMNMVKRVSAYCNDGSTKNLKSEMWTYLFLLVFIISYQIITVLKF